MVKKNNSRRKTKRRKNSIEKRKKSIPWFESYVAQTVKVIEEAFRYNAKRIILAGVKGDIKKGKFTLSEWPKMVQTIQEAVEHDRIKGATWETIEERRLGINHIDELIKRAYGDTHIIICSCPEVYMEKLTRACGVNTNVHLTFARSGDINQLFFDKKDKQKPHLKDDLSGGGVKKKSRKRRKSR
tara:strand:- start:35 stop:589 length:555 start_codon:yes stop_codon:yes gene_type:complete